MTRRVRLLVLVLLLVGSLVACGGGGAAAGGSGTVRWGTSTIPASFDPATVGSRAHQVYMGLIYDALVHAEPDGRLLPGLATAWNLSADARTLELTLREGVVFQDGTPFDASAVAANVEHFQAEGSLLAGTLKMIDKVEVVDPLHVRFVLNRPGGDLVRVLSGYAGMMVSPASLRAGTTGAQPVGAGPFRVGAVTDSRVGFTFWDGYWAADRIVPRAVEVSVMTDDSARLNALKSGQIDAAVISPLQLAEADAAGLGTHDTPASTAYGIGINAAANPVLADPDVRRAIGLAIDRQGINEFLYDGRCQVSAQPYPPEHWAHADDIDEARYTRYDPDAARTAISAAAHGGASLRILTLNITEFPRLAGVIQEQLSRVGIDARVDSVDLADLSARVRTGDFDLLVTLFISGDPDASTWAEQNYTLTPGSTQFIDPALPELIAASRTSVDDGVRGRAIGRVTAKALEAGTNQIVLCLRPATFATGAGVTGFQPNDPRTMRVP